MHGISEEYEKLFYEIRYLILNAYRDSLILKYVRDVQNDNRKFVFPFETKELIIHFIDTIKYDYILTIWKINIDSDESACTINNLYKLLVEYGLQDEIRRESRPKEYKKLINCINCFRNKLISHLDQDRELDKISFFEVDELLDYYRNYFNKFTLQNSLLLEISNKDVLKIQKDINEGFKILLDNIIKTEG
ncbi:MAG: hypothetical protein K5988_03770 [Lachnospiraceae bacterium]|nr:hypothetical protein [Lachnospiraceae bacterium]